ncbi:efflux RND transporter permease subunit, partial [Acinetobacter baumannii]
MTDVAITLDDNDRREPEAVGAILVRGADGSAVTLAEIATIAIGSGRGSITHEAGQRRQVVTANPTGSDVSGFVRAAQAQLARDV